ncbi:hypothetical protein ACI3KS_17225 [Microbacterium sp. ZW T5_45]|uniref:hypothetical protein n=1 Tax=Microbacterium sp. ZW T5_45 TaxID=3378080 RepID=UPI00385502B1
MSTTAPARRTRERLSAIGTFARRAVVMELRVYESIGRAIIRRPAVPHGAIGFHYHQPVQTILIVFIVLSALEIPIIDLIVHPWPVVRIAFLILGIWGLTWMIGLLCGFFMRPHTVGPDGILVREGLEISISLRWDDIASVSRVRNVDEPKSPKVAESDGITSLSVRMQDETNVEIALEHAVTVRLPGRQPKGGAHAVEVIRFWVDDSDAFMAAVRDFIP